MYFDTFIIMVNQNYAKTVGTELYITVLLLVANIVKEIFFHFDKVRHNMEVS